MRTASRIFSGVLAICASTAAQTPPAADASKVFAYDATKPLNLTIGKSEVPTAGVTAFEISYDSPKGGRVPAYLVVPSRKGLFAAMSTCTGYKETGGSFCPRLATHSGQLGARLWRLPRSA